MITHNKARAEAVSYNCESIRVLLKYIRQQEKKDKLFELYKELATVRGDMLYCYKVVDFIPYNTMEKKETQLENEIKELENV